MSLPFLKQLGIGELSLPICTGAVHSGDDSDGIQESFSPADGKLIGKIGKAKQSDYEYVMALFLYALTKLYKIFLFD